MTFLHAIAEGFLYLMHNKWGTYMYVEFDNASGKFEVEISKFNVATLPLQFTCCTEMSFFLHCT
jgi:hypothetical protein